VKYSLPSLLTLTCLALGLLHHPARADEGMWLYSNPPRMLLQKKYGFQLTDAWLQHLQLSSVRFGGASGELVSPDGLVLSNHHVGSRPLQRLSSHDHNYLRDGFYAHTRAEEKPCAGLELSVLLQIEDVTARVNAEVPSGLSDDAAFQARRKVIAAIEKESLDLSGLRSEVVTLFQGAQYHLYRYKKYTDVRLVFAPEEQIAFYGGDPDNFEYPRFDLDICLFRIYESGQPAKIDHYLKWNLAGPAEGDLVFVSGHPGRTDRLRTFAELEFLRDTEYPRTLQRLKRLEVLLGSFAARSAENARRARSDLFSARNSRKVRDGALAGLLDPKLMAPKESAEAKLRAVVASTPSLAAAESAWDRIAQAQKQITQLVPDYDLFERGHGFNSVLFDYARHLLRAAAEQPKSDGDRLEEYRESARASFEFNLFAQNPVYADLETLKLTDSLTLLAEEKGWSNPVLQALLKGKSPQERAAEAVRGTQLASADTRRQWYLGGQKFLDRQADPMLELARLTDDPARAVRKEVEPRREAIRQAHAQIGKARYALEGDHLYPDATSSLRLAFGTVSGYQEEDRHVPFQTTFAGLFERAAGQSFRPPFDLPPRWLTRQKKINPATPLNFVCTADIIGGNSGSPVVNRQGEFVGIIFDGNIQSLVADFVYTDAQARALSVHAGAIIEALDKVYGAHALTAELLGKRK
jgi:Peptidase S46